MTAPAPPLLSLEHVTVLRGELLVLRRKPRVRLLQLLELGVRQSQSLLCELGRALLELLLQSGAIAAVEALLRWRHPLRSTVPIAAPRHE